MENPIVREKENDLFVIIFVIMKKMMTMKNLIIIFH